MVVWKLDRLVRRPSEFESFWEACEAAGVALVSATEPVDTSHELGLALVRILVTFASLESATISLRSKATTPRQRSAVVRCRDGHRTATPLEWLCSLSTRRTLSERPRRV